ncbi:hypothetical protein ES708_27591 [subsurface metagenome]
MGKRTAKDIFTNIAYATVTEDGAGTLTFAELNTGVSVHEKIAWVISRILWYPNRAGIRQIVDDTDSIDMALTLNNQVADITALSDPSVVDLFSLVGHTMGTQATGVLTLVPYVRDFSAMPGGGLIITPKPLYVAAVGTGLGLPIEVKCRILYTIKELAADEFWELVQASRIVQ